MWVQGEKIGNQWLFDDGTPIPNYCPIIMGTEPAEIHLRANGSASFICIDAYNSNKYHYTCEYHRLPTFNNNYH